jgi:hypothetical protein
VEEWAGLGQPPGYSWDFFSESFLVDNAFCAMELSIPARSSKSNPKYVHLWNIHNFRDFREKE